MRKRVKQNDNDNKKERITSAQNGPWQNLWDEAAILLPDFRDRNTEEEVVHVLEMNF
jgi:hypothetical protein